MAYLTDMDITQREAWETRNVSGREFFQILEEMSRNPELGSLRKAKREAMNKRGGTNPGIQVEHFDEQKKQVINGDAYKHKWCISCDKLYLWNKSGKATCSDKNKYGVSKYYVSLYDTCPDWVRKEYENHEMEMQKPMPT